jgi:hypothetical protein
MSLALLGKPPMQEHSQHRRDGAARLSRYWISMVQKGNMTPTEKNIQKAIEMRMMKITFLYLNFLFV